MEDDHMHERPKRLLLACCLGLGLLGAACSSTTNATGTTQSTGVSGTSTFPVTVHAANGVVHITARPHAIVSMSPTATEMLYAIGAGSQVKAVDKDSDYPRQAPHTSLDAFQPNVEAVVSYHPDLVVVSDESGNLPKQLSTLGIPVLELAAAATLADAYAQYGELGAATGHKAQAATEVTHIKTQIAQIVHSSPKAHGATYYYELDPTYFSVTSSTFIGKVLGLLGLKNIADTASSAASSGGYPQLSSEFIVKANPDWVFLADTLCCGQNAQSVAGRPGWSTVTAVKKGQVVGLNDDIASRWGPRIVVLLRAVEEALHTHAGKT
jgi:iron complex transport system substrate-binding protein